MLKSDLQSHTQQQKTTKQQEKKTKKGLQLGKRFLSVAFMRVCQDLKILHTLGTCHHKIYFLFIYIKLEKNKINYKILFYIRIHATAWQWTWNLDEKKK